MKKNQVKAMNCLLSLLVVGAIFVSCKKDSSLEAVNDQEIASSRTLFAKALASAMENKDVRQFVKDEALVMFDNDYDVLYQRIKNKSLSNGKSFEDVLASYSGDPESFKKNTDDDVLLTIYVPHLKAFSAEDWNVSTQQPIVAVRDLNEKKLDKSLSAFAQDGKVISLSYKEEPSVPVIVIKENERVALSSAAGGQKGKTMSTNSRGTVNLKAVANTNKGSLVFTDTAFDPSYTVQSNAKASMSLNATQNATTATGPYSTKGLPAANGKHQLFTQFAGGFPFWNYVESPKMATALNKPAQRDFIYYNLSSNTEEGEYEETHVEYIHSISVNNNGSKGAIVDDARDWTDGFLELYINIVFVNRTGGLDQLLKIISVDAVALFEKEPNVDKPRVYYLPMPIPIVGWDVYKYGDTWKFFVQEYDPGTETTYNSQVSSTHSNNWKTTTTVDGGFKIFKIGFTFKASGEVGGGSSETKTSTYTLKTTGTSDNLGEGILNFGDKVGLGYAFDASPGHEAHNIYTVNTGLIEIGIVPKLKY